MTTQSIFPKDDVEQKPDFPSRTRVDSQGSNYSYSPSPSPTREKAQNHHPYRIKTTSTGILTRSNSSAGTPFSQHSYSPLVSPSAPRTTRSKGHTHRYTKSLSSSNDVFQPPPLPSPTPRSRANSMSRPASQYPDETGLEDDAEIYDRDSSPERPSLVRGLPSSDSESIFGARVRRSETLPSLFTPRVSVTSDPFSELTKELGLPQNPKYWSPTNLSLYIGTVSSVKRGGPLLDHVLRDVQIYLIREKVTGRQFMRVSEVDLDSWGFNSLVKVQLFAQAQELRQRAIKGRIYGFNSRSTSPSKLSGQSGFASLSNSIESSPQSEITLHDSSESDHAGEEQVGASDWMGRAMKHSHKTSPRHSAAAGSVSSRYSTPSRRSLGRLNHEESRGRVRGMVESFESGSSGRSRDGSVSSSFSSASAEQEERVVEYLNDLETEEAIAPEVDYQGQEVDEGEDEDPEGDVTITSPESHLLQLSHEAAEDPVDVSQHVVEEALLTSTDDFALHLIPDEEQVEEPMYEEALNYDFDHDDLHNNAETLQVDDDNEPSMEELLDESEEYVSHPWEEDIIGQTARRIPSTHATPEKSCQNSRKSNQIGDSETQADNLAPLLTIFDHPHLSSIDCAVTPLTNEEPLPGEAESVQSQTAPPSYTDQSVAADIIDDPTPETQPEPTATNETETTIPEGVYDLLESFRVRLAEVEQRLDEMEQREAQRELADREEISRREEMEEAAMLAAEEETARRHKTSSTQSTDVSVEAIPIVIERTSIGVSTDSGVSLNRKPSTSSQKSKSRGISRKEQTAPPSEYLPDGLPQFIIGASIGIFVIAVQHVVKRFSGRRA